MARSMKVAVIGAGTAGLVSARELQREGHQVTVFEKTDRIGGIWVYDPRVESDPLGLDPNREIVQSSIYKSLRLNTPRQLVCFLDYPFERKEGGDARSFPGHEELLRYLEDFARDFGLHRLIRFGHQVMRVEPIDEAGDEWVVGWKTKGTEFALQGEEIFEAVVVCTGKYTEPRIADFPGRDDWPKIQMHSHNYRTPEPFENKIVVVIGNGNSAGEILSEICDVAKEVHQAMRQPKLQHIKWDKIETKWHQHPMIECAQDDGTVIFQDKSFVCADAIIHCTGYHFHYPFLRTNGRVTVDDNRVGPLYKHVFPPSLAPGLSFVGLPQMVVPSVVSELQSKWVARILSGKLSLPTREEMLSSTEEFYRQLEKDGIPKYHTHKLRQEECEYENWLIDKMGEPPLEKWREQLMCLPKFVKIVSAFDYQYRDTWDADKWIQEFQNSEHT